MCWPLLMAFANVPRIVYVPAGSGIVASCPAATLSRARIAPLTGSVSVIVPALGVPEIEAHRGTDLKTCGPPSRYRPLRNAVGPGLRSGSPCGGPAAADPEQRGFTQIVITPRCRPGSELCRPIV